MDPTNPGQTLPDKQLDAAAKVLGFRPQRVDVRAATNLDAAFAAALRQRVESLFVYPLPIAPVHSQRIVEFAIKNRLPTIAITPAYVRAGLLMSYGPNSLDQYRRAGIYVGKILKGAKAADLPVEQGVLKETDDRRSPAAALGSPHFEARKESVHHGVETVVWTYPANQATSNWTVVPPNWSELRTQWEYSHAANAVVTFMGLCAVALSIVMARD